MLGQGFVLEPKEAQALIQNDARNRQVLFPYLNGEDLNSRFDLSPSRWVIYFRDWSREVAEEYPDCMRRVYEKVKPERDRNTYSRAAREKWWQYERPRSELYATVADLERVLVKAQVSNTWAWAFVPRGLVYDAKLNVFAFESADAFAILQSTLHWAWAVQYGTTLRLDMSYTPTRNFETFPFPSVTTNLEGIGERYHAHRQGIMQVRQEGLTKTYNRFHDPNEVAEDIERLRELHAEMDEAVADAYGWGDLDLGHGFHETKQGLRYTISEEARREVLDRLLLLNHERYDEEVKQGLHDKKAKKGTGKKRSRKKLDDGAHSLFGPGDGS